MITAEDVLAEAARRIEIPGHWWQAGDPIRQNLPRECMWLACHRQMNGCEEDIQHLLYGRKAPVLDAILQEIGAPLMSGLNPIYAWNDTPGRTAEEVASTLRNAKRWL